MGPDAPDSAVTGRLSVEEEVALFLKDRREHVEMLIAPALARGAWVLLDRYYLSMMAYQGARGIDPEVIRAANEEFAPVPDAVVWLDIPVSVALERIGNRGERDAFETEAGLAALPQRVCIRPCSLDVPHRRGMPGRKRWRQECGRLFPCVSPMSLGHRHLLSAIGRGFFLSVSFLAFGCYSAGA